ncbi:NAD(P)H-dependent glycerol-3-phosphate dehydrogenase [Desulfopila sp. IMCC35008]|uniref:NAD(P)H-dependent glycerol-3-phosphate dehydrogenase n=1 Tax=Desulfopila sp. IMCC35008 TaxID=2653858 RepID=UPI0013D7FE12|nr:NAD(P)H-dependent glycerol-3-phosphate dehydrogenase [Desulfopila sp. IMCC35008]
MKKQNLSKTAVIGAGSWGTALSLVLASNYDTVALWGHKRSDIAKLQSERENKKYLSGFILPENIHPVSNLGDAVKGCDIVTMVVPSHGFREVYRNVAPLLEEKCCVVSAVKGIEISSLMTMSQVIDDINKELQIAKRIRTAVLSGPSFAKEVAQNLPTAVTIGCSDIDTAKYLQKCFVTPTFRVYAATDVIGLEISAALKNIVAIGAGICDGLGYGMNTRAALITRGIAELTRFGVAVGADRETFFGLSGIGDLMLTCTGDLSRNRSVGLKLGQGIKLEQIIEEMDMVAEGVKTTRSVYGLAQKLNIDMPILEQVYEILYNNKDCSKAVEDLLKRELKIE